MSKSWRVRLGSGGEGVDFKTADGFTVCSHCGASYSGTLSMCPGCGKEPPQMETPVIHRRYLCNAGHLCQMGGPDGVCCISCRGYHSCTQPCHTAQDWMNILDDPKWRARVPMKDEDDLPILFGRVLCEYLIKEGS